MKSWANNALLRTAIPLRCMAAGELCRYPNKSEPPFVPQSPRKCPLLADSSHNPTPPCP